MTGDGTEALRIARELHDLAEDISSRLETARRYGRRTRLLSWCVIAIVAVCVLLGGLVVRELAHEHGTAVRICRSGNDARQAQRQLWEYVLGLSSHHPPAGETTAERNARLAEVHRFQQYVAAHFASLRC